MDSALRYVAKKEKFDLPDNAAVEIIKDSRGNLRKALLVLEALKMQSYVHPTNLTLLLKTQLAHHTTPQVRPQFGDLNR